MKFEGKLEIGQPAMIINTFKPENRHLIGTVVTVEAFWVRGQNVTSFFVGAPASPGVVVGSGHPEHLVVVSGSKVTGKTRDGTHFMEPGWTNIEHKFLMPLPPLDELEIQKERELEMVD